MTQEFVLAIMKNALWTTLLVAGPILLLGLVAGLAVGIFQAVTQIQEMTLTFIPKILLVALALALFLPWMLNQMLTFTLQIFHSIAGVR
ncbi:MAG: flagellar biosynthetic protein FliQ [Calditrichaeota bacterium]|nr:MAG: flagellar biosynthetic protein FliQ [Calditrichota bacterium]